MKDALSLIQSNFESLDDFVSDLLIHFPDFVDVEDSVVAAHYDLGVNAWARLQRSRDFNDALDRVLALDLYDPVKRRSHMLEVASIAAGKPRVEWVKDEYVDVPPSMRDMKLADEHLRALQGRVSQGTQRSGGITIVVQGGVGNNYGVIKSESEEFEVIDAEVVDREVVDYGGYRPAEVGDEPPEGAAHAYSAVLTDRGDAEIFEFEGVAGHYPAEESGEAWLDRHGLSTPARPGGVREEAARMASELRSVLRKGSVEDE